MWSIINASYGISVTLFWEMNEMKEFITNGGLVALLLFILPALTGLKQALNKYKKTTSPGWLNSVIAITEKILEYMTANDGQYDDKEEKS
jgi:tryptophan-rich sensory protein